MLNDFKLLQELYSYSLDLGMVPLVEVNDDRELTQALKLTYHNATKEPLIIGVNNRNLTNFNVDLGTTSSLVDQSKEQTMVEMEMCWYWHYQESLVLLM